jgi:hypothetical protein
MGRDAADVPRCDGDDADDDGGGDGIAGALLMAAAACNDEDAYCNADDGGLWTTEPCV